MLTQNSEINLIDELQRKVFAFSTIIIIKNIRPCMIIHIWLKFGKKYDLIEKFCQYSACQIIEVFIT